MQTCFQGYARRIGIAMVAMFEVGSICEPALCHRGPDSRSSPTAARHACAAEAHRQRVRGRQCQSFLRGVSSLPALVPGGLPTSHPVRALRPRVTGRLDHEGSRLGGLLTRVRAGSSPARCSTWRSRKPPSSRRRWCRSSVGKIHPSHRGSRAYTCHRQPR